MHSLQPCQLGNDSLLNMVLYPLLDMRGGASLCKPLEMPGGFGVAPVKGVSGVATTGRIWAESQKIPLLVVVHAVQGGRFVQVVPYMCLAAARQLQLCNKKRCTHVTQW